MKKSLLSLLMHHFWTNITLFLKSASCHYNNDYGQNKALRVMFPLVYLD